MKLPLTATSDSILDADKKVVVTTATWLSDFMTDSENANHVAAIVTAVNEADALRAQNAALVNALELIESLCERTASLLRTPQGRVVTAEGQAELFASLATRAKDAIAAAESEASNDA